VWVKTFPGRTTWQRACESAARKLLRNKEDKLKLYRLVEIAVDGGAKVKALVQVDFRVMKVWNEIDPPNPAGDV